MSISFVAATNGGATSDTSLTYSHTITTGNFLVVAVETPTDVTTGVTYAGVSMTQVVKMTSGTSAVQYLYVLQAPTSGANNVVISRSSSGEIRSVCAQYSGVKQSVTIDNSGTATNPGPSDSSMTISLTPVANNCWMISTGGYQRTPSAGTGTTQRARSDNAFGIYDNNAAISPATSTTLQITWTGGPDGAGSMGMAAITVAPLLNNSGFFNFA